MDAAVQGDPRADATKGPGPGAGRRDARSDPVSKDDFLFRTEMLESGGQAPHFVEPLGLRAFQLRLMFWPMRGQPSLEMRLEILPDFGMTIFAHAAGDAAPHNPELHPDRLLLVKRYALREHGGGLLASPFIEG